MPRLDRRLLLLSCVALLGATPVCGQSPPKARQALADRHGDPLPPGALARLGTVRLRHAAEILCLAFSPDGTTLASGGHDRTLRIWDVATGKEIRRLGADRHPVAGVLFSPDGKILISAESDPQAGGRTVRLWDTVGGKQLRSLPGTTAAHASLALTADGKLLAGIGADGSVLLWDTATGNEPRRFAHEKGRCTTLALSPDGKFLAAGLATRQLVLWDTATGRGTLRPAWHRGAVRALVFAPDSSTLAVADAGPVVVGWDVGTGARVRQLGSYRGQGQPIVFSADGKRLASAGREKCYLWDTQAGKELGPFVGHRKWVNAVAFSPDGRMLASAGDDRTIRIWDVATRKQIDVGAAEAPGSAFVRFTPDGGRLAVRHVFHDLANAPSSAVPGLGYATLRLWEKVERQETAKEIAVPPDSPHTHLSAVTAPDGKVTAVSVAEGLVRLLEEATGKELRQFGKQGRGFSAWPVGFSPDGAVLAVVSNEGRDWRAPAHRLRLWDAATGKPLRDVGKEIYEEPPWSFHFSPDGQTMAAVVRKGQYETSAVALWSVETGALLERLGQGRAEAAWCDFTLDGRFLLSGGDARDDRTRRTPLAPKEQRVVVRELATGKTALVLGGLTDPWCCAVSPDGRVVALGEAGGEIPLLDLATGKELRRLRGHSGPVCSLAFSLDGKVLVSGGCDSTVLVWGVPDRMRPPAVPLGAETLQGLWADLARDDAARAYLAVARLSASPAEAVAFLKERVKAIPVAEAARVRRLLGDLNSSVFAVRRRAMTELASLEGGAVPLLRDALKEGPAPEVRQRVEQLLAAAADPAAAPERLRQLRALDCLERIDTAEACRVLDALARGAPAAHLTRAADASLRRLARRAAGPKEQP
jgi:WD40 repeat protein